MFRIIVFDLDGTLVDSRRDLADAANLVLEQCGGAALSEGAIGAMVGDGAAALVARAFTAAGVLPPPDALDRFLEVYGQRLLVHTRAYEGVPELLAYLYSRTDLAVLTNKPIGASREILEGLGLAPYFEAEAIVGGDGAFGRKPAPDGLLHLCARAGVAADATLLVGDSPIDWRTAKRAGTAICLARYGFGFTSFHIDDLHAEDLVIDRPADLVRVYEKNTLR